MKHTAFILAALAIAGLSASCQKSEPVIETGETITFSASIEGKARPAGAKAVIDGDTPKWEAGDAVRLYCFSTGIDDATYAAGKTSPAFKTSASLTSGGAASATFTFSVTGTMGQADCFLATIGEIPTSVYWAKKDGSQGPKVRVAHLGYDKTSLQNKGTHNTRAACAVGRTLAFKNVWHLIRYTPTVTGAAYAVLSSIDGTTPVTNQVADIFFESATGNVTSVVHAGLDRTAVYAQVTSGEENYFSLAPGMTITGGFKIEIMDDGDNVLQTFTYAHDFTTVRNRITTISNFDDRVEESTKAILKNGSDFNSAAKTVSGDYSMPTIWTANTYITSIAIDTRSSVTTGTEIQAPSSDVPIYANFDNGVLTLSTSANKIYLPSNAQNMFCEMRGLTTFVNFSKLAGDDVTNAASMFYNCDGLVDFPDMSLPQANTVADMFQDCSSLETVGTISIPSAGTVYEMFQTCSSLVSVQNIQMDAADNASSMFQDCTALTTLTLSGVDNNTLTSMGRMFQNCSSLENLTFSPVSNKVTQVNRMFSNCQKLASVDVSGISGSLTMCDAMFYNCSALTGITFNDGFNTSNITDFSDMFYRCSSLTSLDISMFDTHFATTMSEMFCVCSKLATLTTGTNFATNNLTNAYNMFNGCQKLTAVDVSRLAGNIQNLQYMFSSCSLLTAIHLSNNFNTAAVQSYAGVFDYCTSLSQLYIKGFHLTKGNVGTTSSQLASRLMNALRGVPSTCTIHYSTNTTSEWDVRYYLPYTTTTGTSTGGYNWTTAN